MASLMSSTEHLRNTLCRPTVFPDSKLKNYPKTLMKLTEPQG